jgi:type VI protein secretion system component VasK
LSFLTNHDHKTNGLERLAIMNSLPYALLIWGFFFFVAAFMSMCLHPRKLGVVITMVLTWLISFALLLWCVKKSWVGDTFTTRLKARQLRREERRKQKKEEKAKMKRENKAAIGHTRNRFRLERWKTNSTLVDAVSWKPDNLAWLYKGRRNDKPRDIEDGLGPEMEMRDSKSVHSG